MASSLHDNYLAFMSMTGRENIVYRIGPFVFVVENSISLKFEALWLLTIHERGN